MTMLIDELKLLVNKLNKVGSTKTATKLGELVEELSKEAGFEKFSYIRRRGKKWVVLSHKGKVLGTYKTKAEAQKRLRQVEFWKRQ